MRTFSDFLTELNRFEKEKGTDTKTGKPVVKGGTAKDDKALQSVMKKYGNQRMGANQPKKVKGAKSTVGTNKYKDMADKKKETAADAKKRGFDNVQSYVDAMARYGGKKNYDQGKGLGS